MNIYKYIFNEYAQKLEKTVVEVEEMPATYVQKGSIINSRFHKDEVGKVKKYGTQVILLEDDTKKAAGLFLEFEKQEKERMEKAVKRNEACIEYLKGVIDE